jgi:hypothetical protein
MFWVLPRIQFSPPFGEVTVIVWDWDIADAVSNKMHTKASFFTFSPQGEYFGETSRILDPGGSAF